MLTKIKKVKIKVLDMPLLDTDKKDETLIDSFLREIVLLILAFVAEQEWHNIKARQTQGIESAKEEGKHLGRPKTILDNETLQAMFKIINECQNGNISKEEAMKQLDRGRTTFYKLVKLYELKMKGGEEI